MVVLQFEQDDKVGVVVDALIELLALHLWNSIEEPRILHLFALAELLDLGGEEFLFF